MNSYEPRRPADDAYTGETIVMRKRRASPPLRPITPRRRPWRWLRRGLLIAVGLVLLLLIVFYVQIRSVAGRIVGRTFAHPTIPWPAWGLRVNMTRAEGPSP
jgi:hypothetical protein